MTHNYGGIMSKIRNKNIILGSDERIIFPNSQISDTDSTSGLSISGISSINASKIAGIPIDNSSLADQAVLKYDQASGSMIFASQGGGGAVLDNIQFGEVTITGSKSGTTAINSIDVNKSVIFLLGFRPSGGSLSTTSPRIELTNSTLVTAYQTSSVNDNIVRFMVVEFSSGIASSQGGNITLSFSQTNDDTISEVDLSKSILIHLGTVGGAAEITRSVATISFVNSTTVRVTASASNAILTVGYHVLEFN